MDPELVQIVHAMDNLKSRILLFARRDPSQAARYMASAEKIEEARFQLIGSRTGSLIVDQTP